MSKAVNSTPKRAIVAAVQLTGVSDIEFEASLAELRELAKTLGFEMIATFTQRRASFDTMAYLGAGKREEIRRLCRASLRRRCFRETARAPPPSRRGGQGLPSDPRGIRLRRPRDLAVAGAQPRKRGRLRGDGPHHGHPRNLPPPRALPRCARAGGDRAPAATWRRACARRRSWPGRKGGSAAASAAAAPASRTPSWTSARSATASPNCSRKSPRWMSSARRSARGGRSSQGLASVALVGYTNAGKSTLMRALTGSEVLVANKLFATLDTTVRALQPESSAARAGQRHGRLHQEPAARAGRLVQVDARRGARCLAAAPRHRRQRSRLRTADRGHRQGADEIGAQDVPRLRVFNKIDHVGDAAAQAEREAALRAQYPDCIVMSARRADDVAKLHEAIVAFFQQEPGRGRAVSALVGTATARRNLRALRGAGGARRRRGRVLPRARRARGRRRPARAYRSGDGGTLVADTGRCFREWTVSCFALYLYS